MERGLYERDLVGLQDFILLEDCNSEEAFIDNLRKRFHADLIYVRAGVIVANQKSPNIHPLNTRIRARRRTSDRCWSPSIRTRS